MSTGSSVEPDVENVLALFDLKHFSHQTKASWWIQGHDHLDVQVWVLVDLDLTRVSIGSSVKPDVEDVLGVSDSKHFSHQNMAFWRTQEHEH